VREVVADFAVARSAHSRLEPLGGAPERVPDREAEEHPFDAVPAPLLREGRGNPVEALAALETDHPSVEESLEQVGVHGSETVTDWRAVS
jgi:hypothetical protein